MATTSDFSSMAKMISGDDGQQSADTQGAPPATPPAPPVDQSELPPTQAATPPTQAATPPGVNPEVPVALDQELETGADQAVEGEEAEAPPGKGCGPRCLKYLKLLKHPLTLYSVLVCIAILSNTLVAHWFLRTRLGPRRYDVSPMDMGSQGSGFATFCQEFTLEASVPFTTYMLLHPARIDPNNRLVQNIDQGFDTCKFNSTEFNYYLLPGTTVRSFADYPSGCMDAFIIKGEANNAKMLDGTCSHCWDNYKRLIRGQTYTHYDPDETDTYYFAYHTCGGDCGYFDLLYFLNRTVYDVSNPSYSYVNKTKLVIKPDSNLAASVVWRVSDFNSTDTGPLPVLTTSCRFRVWPLILLFSLVPLAVMLLFSLPLFFWYRKAPGQNPDVDPLLPENL